MKERQVITLQNNANLEIIAQKIPKNVKINGINYVISSKQEIAKLKSTIRAQAAELINSMLEREILREMPKDFDDVYVIAKSLIDKKKNLTRHDIKRTIKEIKLNHPNLFIDIDEYFNEMIEFND